MRTIPPATLEGWYVLHQMFDLDWVALRTLPADERADLAAEARGLFEELATPEEGWSRAYRLVGGGADVLFVHFRPRLDDLERLELRLQRSGLGEWLQRRYDYLSVTEAGLYHATAEAAEAAPPGSKEFERALAERVEAEAASPYLKTRLYPRVPEGMRYLSFYPMNKRRSGEDNWYRLDVVERNRLMREHGLTGRTFSGRVFQVITGSVGFDDWEWGVTLFARDPLEFKRIVTDMRYDEVSARYAEFGPFFTGIEMEPAAWPALLGAE